MKHCTVTSSNWKILALIFLRWNILRKKYFYAKIIYFLSPKMIKMVNAKKLKSEVLELNILQYDRTENTTRN